MSRRTRIKKTSAAVNGVLQVTGLGTEVIIDAEVVDAATDDAEVIEPPYDPRALCMLFEQSNALRENVDSYATNIDSWGNRFTPAIDLDAEDADDQISESLFAHNVESRGVFDVETLITLEPTPEEVAEARRVIKVVSRAERARLEAWFESCCDTTFVELRRRMRSDLEITGNAYWEVLRDARGLPARLLFVSSTSMRLAKVDSEAVKVRTPMRTSPLTWRDAVIPRRFRRFAQMDDADQPSIWFKEFGDPRTMSKVSGTYFPSVEAMLLNNPDDVPATEIMHFKIHSPRSAYGIPRWAGRLLAVLGSRAMEEVNLSYFNNKSVPPMAVLVSGGARLNDETVGRIERFMKENIRGRENFWSILLLQAEAGKGQDNRTPKIELKPLTEAQIDDATHQAYDEANTGKVGRAFRLPNLLRGDAKDFNRATAQASLKFAEDQVFSPERESFDSYLNRFLMPELGARFWSFQSRTRLPRDPERLADMVEKLVKVGVMTPEEGRAIAEDIFNTKFQKIDEDWVRRPLTLTLAGIQTSQQAPGKGREVAEKLRGLQSVLLDEDKLAALDLVRSYTRDNDDF